MSETTVKAPVKGPRSIEVLMKLTAMDYATLTKEETKILREALSKSVPSLVPARTYQKQEMDEACDVIADLALGKTDGVPEAYLGKKLSKEQYQALRDAVGVVVKLGSQMVKPGHVFDLRFDQRGHGWFKFTENWRKNGPPGKDGEPTNKMQDEFDSYKDNPTVKLF